MTKQELQESLEKLEEQGLVKKQFKDNEYEYKLTTKGKLYYNITNIFKKGKDESNN